MKGIIPQSRDWRRQCAVKIDFSMSESRLDKKVQSLRRLNKDLRILVSQVNTYDHMGNGDSEVAKGCFKPEKPPKRYSQIRDEAMGLYNSLKFSCTKHEVHFAFLDLQPLVDEKHNGRVTFDLAF